MKTVIFFLLCLNLLLSSCFTQGCAKLKLADSELEWYQSYKNNEIVIFESNYHNIDTFRIEKFTGYTDCNKFEIGIYQYNYFFIYFNSIDNDYPDISLEFEKKEKDKPCLKNFNLYHTSECYSEINFQLEEIELKSKKYEAYKFIFTKTPFTNQDDVSIFYWSKEFGLLRYETLDGEVFQLIDRHSN